MHRVPHAVDVRDLVGDELGELGVGLLVHEDVAEVRQPDAEAGEQCGNEAAVDLDRVFEHEEAKLDQPEHNNQDPAAQAVDECVDERLLLHE